MNKKRNGLPDKRAKPANPFRIDARRDVDLDYPGYEVAKALDAHVASLGIRYLHLTDPENADSIRSEGLRSEQGLVYFADTALVLADIALTQVFSQDFHLFGLQPGKSWRLVPDEAGELIERHQWVYESPRIPPDCLMDLGPWRAALPLGSVRKVAFPLR